jgi:hypothetical protein
MINSDSAKERQRRLARMSFAVLLILESQEELRDGLGMPLYSKLHARLSSMLSSPKTSRASGAIARSSGRARRSWRI